MPLSAGASIVIIVPAGVAKRSKQTDPATIVLAPSGQPITISFDTHGTLPTGDRGAILNIKHSALPALFAATSVAIEAGDVAASIAPSTSLAAFKALQSCEAESMIRWGIDPAAIAAATTPAEPINPEQFMHVEDYPLQSLQRRSQGTTLIVLQVGTDGKARDCRTLVSAGDPDLNKAVCSALKRRAAFKPARDREGRAIPTWWTHRVTWRLPR